ncbi:hypothetical protein [Taibaiella helva]|uniref:hypothetical protein n=1 Tax=Taibaiella helva TaxID=2301235 RepID=UPI000E57C0CD|nr:hypothetical protein [Taibaiella helva]
MFKKFGAVALALCLYAGPVLAQNGDQPATDPLPDQQYRTNIARIAPTTAMDVGVGFGIGYEKILGKAQMIGIVLPVYMLLEKKNNYTFDVPYKGSKYYTYVYFTPGIKIYPMGQHKVTYAVGPNLMLGYGGGNDWQYQVEADGSEHLYSVKTTRWRLGFLINNYVNFQVSKSFNLGLEGGLGIRYMDRVTYSGSNAYAAYAGNGEFNYGLDITGQFSLTLGYRF